MPDNTVPEQLKPHLFKPGQSGNPAGRPKGSRAKLAESFCAALLKDFEESGEAAIQLMRAEKPGEYIRAVASVIPKEFEGTVSGDLSDEMKRWLGIG